MGKCNAPFFVNFIKDALDFRQTLYLTALKFSDVKGF